MWGWIMECRKFLLFQLFFVLILSFFMTVHAEAKKLIPMGESIGIQLKLPFVYVSNDVLLPSGDWLRKGDVLERINGNKITSLADFENALQEDTITITIKQKSKKKDIQLFKDQVANILPFLKDETDGIGTLTYVDPTKNEYGALGHQIVDGVLNKAPDFKDGAIFLASIEQIKKSVPGQPGYKISVVDEHNIRLGNVLSNNVYGIFGKWENNLQQSVRKPLEIMPEKDIQLGKAEIYTAIEGNEVESFTIEITKKEKDSIQFVVTDEKLLKKTGGILQGMSGSPIVQNNRFVGAVTHMFVEQPKKGAAIYVKDMLEKANE